MVINRNDQILSSPCLFIENIEISAGELEFDQSYGKIVSKFHCDFNARDK